MVERGSTANLLLYELQTLQCSGKPSVCISADWFQGWAVKVNVTQVYVKLSIDQKAKPVVNEGTDILSSPSRLGHPFFSIMQAICLKMSNHSVFVKTKFCDSLCLGSSRHKLSSKYKL